jgi:hypothetical protein
LSIYRYERRIWLALEGENGIKQSKRISGENKEKLLEYATYLKATGKSLARQDKLVRTVKKLAELLGSIPFKEATKPDLVNVLAKVEGTDNTRSDFQSARAEPNNTS